MIQARQRTILYVDDTEAQRYAMRRILEGADFTVVEAGSVRHLLDKRRHTLHDLHEIVEREGEAGVGDLERGRDRSFAFEHSVDVNPVEPRGDRT
mgnify:CR=1 FL=1